MSKKNRYYMLTSSLLVGIIVIIVGLFFLLMDFNLYKRIINIFTFSILLIGTYNFVKYFLKQEDSFNRNIIFSKTFLNLLFVLVLSLFPGIPLSIIPIVFGLYMLLNAIVRLLTFIALVKNNASGKIKEFIMMIIYLTIGIPMLFAPIQSIELLLKIIGIYLILLGTTYIKDFVSSLVPRKYKNKLNRRIRISLPVLFEAIIPYQVLKEINQYMNKTDDDKIIKNLTSNKENIEPDMEVFVHTSERGYNRFGHVDLYFDGEVISYGNYDCDSKKYFDMFGDGVLFTTNSKDKYIPFCIKESDKTIFGFGLKLTDKQKNNIRKHLNKMRENLYEWDPSYKKNINCKDRNKYDDYSSRLYRKTKANFYKFKSGRFKTYFIVGINCCLLADQIIGKSGSDILKMNGIITPGAYYEYLNNEFYKNNSMVITKTVYNEKTTKKKRIFNFRLFKK